MPIRVLPPDIAALIAAGEVVQRPASVVKELIDNALDAGAARVHVELERAGLRLIRIVDDGSGMSREDALLCLEKHATSKISTADDLQAILTLGFRGEALAAISAVAQVEIVTRRREDEVGTRLVAHGAERRVEDAGCPAGTTVAVYDLFADVPARRKFLKTETTEFRHATDAVIRAALTCEQVHFSLEHNKRRALELPRCESRAERIHALLGRETFEQLLPVAYEREGISVHGWISCPTLNRNSSAQVSLFVNERYVQNRTLLAALMESYRNVLPKGRFPVAVLYLELDPRRVDINVHPSKMEIRFDDDSAAFRAVHAAVHHTLATGGREPAPHLERSEAERDAVRVVSAPVVAPAPRPSWEHTRSALESFLAAPTDPETPGASDDAAALRARIAALNRTPTDAEQYLFAGPPRETAAASPEAGTPPDPGDPLRGFVPRAYVLGTFLLAESADRLMIMDTHAAHERVLYERLKTQLVEKRIESQALLFPLELDLGAAERALLEEHADQINRLGFSVAPFGDQTYLISAIPAHTTAERAPLLLRDVLNDFASAGGRDSMEELQHKLLITMSCHGAHRAGAQLDMEEMRELLAQYWTTPHHETCPHGRPTALYWNKDEMGRLFGR